MYLFAGDGKGGFTKGEKITDPVGLVRVLGEEVTDPVGLVRLLD